MAARVVINELSVAKFVATNPMIQKAVQTAGGHIMEQARINAPTGRSVSWFGSRHGYYKAHFALRPWRGGYRVWNDDPFAHLVEWGSVKNSAYAPMRRAVRQSGLRYKPNSASRGA